MPTHNFTLELKGNPVSAETKTKIENKVDGLIDPGVGEGQQGQMNFQIDEPGGGAQGNGHQVDCTYEQTAPNRWEVVCDVS